MESAFHKLKSISLTFTTFCRDCGSRGRGGGGGGVGAGGGWQLAINYQLGQSVTSFLQKDQRNLVVNSTEVHIDQRTQFLLIARPRSGATVAALLFPLSEVTNLACGFFFKKKKIPGDISGPKAIFKI